MEMTWIEKQLVNRPGKAEGNIARVRGQLSRIDSSGIEDVLELGCGVGVVSAHLAGAYGWRVCGTDYDSDQIALARERNNFLPNLRYRREDGARLSFPDNSFDLVLSQNVFHHIPEWPAATREVVRVLRPGGYLFWYDLTVPPAMKRILRPFARVCGLYSYEELSTAFRANGLRTREERKSSSGPFAHYQLVLEKS